MVYVECDGNKYKKQKCFQKYNVAINKIKSGNWKEAIFLNQIPDSFIHTFKNRNKYEVIQITGVKISFLYR